MRNAKSRAAFLAALLTLTWAHLEAVPAQATDTGSLEISVAPGLAYGSVELTVDSDGPESVAITVSYLGGSGESALCKVDVSASSGTSFDYRGTRRCKVPSAYFGDVELRARRESAALGRTVFSASRNVTVVDPALSAINLSVPMSKMFPFVDGYRDGPVEARITATNSAGQAVPFSGVAWIVSGRAARFTSLANSPDVGSATVRLSLAKVPLGNGRVTIRLTGADGSVMVQSRALSIVPTGARSASVTLSNSRFFPQKDGYLDSIAITVSAQSTTTLPVRGTGVVRVIDSRKRTVTTWQTSGSSQRRFTWAGTSRLVPGKYTVEYVFQGPQGKAVSAHASVQVYGGRVGWSSTATSSRTSGVSTGDFKKAQATFNWDTGTLKVHIWFWDNPDSFTNISVSLGSGCGYSTTEAVFYLDGKDMLPMYDPDRDRELDVVGSTNILSSQEVELTMQGRDIRSSKYSCVGLETWWSSDYYHYSSDCDCITRTWNEDEMNVRRRR